MLHPSSSLSSGEKKKTMHHRGRIKKFTLGVITRTPSIEHITLALQQLHWLPIKSRIDFKFLLPTFKILHNLAPSYLSELCHIYTRSRTLRSSSAIQLFALYASLTTMGSIAFSQSASPLWNFLPPDICNSNTVSNFKSRLKTHLFQVAYPVSH